MNKIKVNIINKSSFDLPAYQTELSAGMDLSKYFGTHCLKTFGKSFG